MCRYAANKRLASRSIEAAVESVVGVAPALERLLVNVELAGIGVVLVGDLDGAVGGVVQSLYTPEPMPAYRAAPKQPDSEAFRVRIFLPVMSASIWHQNGDFAAPRSGGWC